jgi:ribosome-binding protein aMBF1 (putative translation factor)
MKCEQCGRHGLSAVEQWIDGQLMWVCDCCRLDDLDWPPSERNGDDPGDGS